MMDIPLLEQGRNPDGFMNRWLREIARHVHSLYDILTTGTMTIRKKPVLGKSILSCLMGRAKVNTLKPERRFDAAVKALMPWRTPISSTRRSAAKCRRMISMPQYGPCSWFPSEQDRRQGGLANRECGEITSSGILA